MIFSGFNNSEEHQLECKDLAEAIRLKDMLLRGRPYYGLTEVMEVSRG